MNHRDSSTCGDPAICPTGIASSSAFARIVCACAGDLYRYAYWLCQEPSRAEHLVINTFSRAPASLFDEENEHAVRCRLFSLVRHEHGAGGATVAQDAFDPREPAAGEHVEASRSLRERMRALADQELEPLILQVLGFSVDEIARIVGATPRSVALHLRHARSRIAP